MRGIAAVSVIFTHIYMFGAGAFGVDLFFCISGFIMMFITENGGEKFLQKRAVRIIPLYWLGILAAIALLIVMPQYFRSTHLTFPHIVKSLLFIPYADDVSQMPLLTVGWTLVCEVFFYVIFFAAMKISHRYRHYISSVILCAIVILSLIFSKNLSPDILNYYGNPIMFEFIFGMFAFKLLIRTASNTGESKKQSASFLTAAVAVWILLFIQQRTDIFAGIDRLFKWGIPALIFFVLVFKFFENRSVPKFLVFVGNISYSIYITHFFIVQGFSRLVYDIDIVTPVGVALVFFVVIPLCIFTAFISWYIVEYKVTEFLRRKLNI